MDTYLPNIATVHLHPLVLERLRRAFEVAFPADPVPPLPEFPARGVDQVEVERVRAVFGGKPWTAVTEADVMQFGFDLGYWSYLDLRCRAYYLPALLLIGASNLDVLEALSSAALWREPGTGRSVLGLWSDRQRQWIALTIALIDAYGLSDFGHEAERWTIRPLLAAVEQQ